MDRGTRELLLEITHCPIVELCKNDAPGHPCAKVVSVQAEVSLPMHQVPEPWSGDLSSAPVLFIASNPSISWSEDYPTWSWSAAQRVDFFDRRFGGGEKEWTIEGARSLQLTGTHGGVTRFWSAVQKRAEELLERRVRPGVDYALTEVVRCKSRKDYGVREAASTCASLYLRRTVEASSASVIVVLGQNALRIVHAEFGCPEPFQLAGPIEVGARRRMFVHLGHPSSGQPKRFGTCLDSSSRERLRTWVAEARDAAPWDHHVQDVVDEQGRPLPLGRLLEDEN